MIPKISILVWKHQNCGKITFYLCLLPEDGQLTRLPESTCKNVNDKCKNIRLKCEERRAWTSYKIMSTTRFLLNRLGKVSKDSRSSFPIYEIGNALEYFVFSSNISEIQSRRRCRVFVSLILLHKIIWPSVDVKILILFRCASIS